MRNQKKYFLIYDLPLLLLFVDPRPLETILHRQHLDHNPLQLTTVSQTKEVANIFVPLTILDPVLSKLSPGP